MRKQQGFDWILLALAGMAVIVLFYRFYFGDGFIAYYHDDFFYYLKIATNLVQHKKSSFDGIHLTNGYHPLYMLLIAGMTWVLPFKAFFVTLQILMLISVLATYLAVSSTLCLFTENILLARVAAAIISYFGMILMRGGMEIILTIPLAAGFVYFLLRPGFRWTALQSFSLGLMTSLVVLSRLDSILFFALLMCFYLIWQGKEIRERWKQAGLILLGCSPIGIYVLLNLYWFHVVMPISGQAKELRTSHLPSFLPFRTEFLAGFSPTRNLFTVPAGVLLLLAVALIWKHRKQFDRHSALVLWALLLFPVLHLAFYSITSDWPFFPWYFYPLVLSSIAACAVFLRVGKQRINLLPPPLANAIVWACVILLLVFSLLLVKAQSPKDREVYETGLEVQGFAKNHPGVYAMGDCAGYVGYLVNDPIIQLEGIVEDKEYLAKLRAREPLLSILNDYGVDYYIGLSPKENNGCHIMTEPTEGGPSSMKIYGTFCEKPLATFVNRGVELVIFSVPRSTNKIGSPAQ